MVASVTSSKPSTTASLVITGVIQARLCLQDITIFVLHLKYPHL